jgi:hypothetical protein
MREAMTENPLHSRVLLHSSTLLGRLAVDGEAFFEFEEQIRQGLACLEQRWVSLAAPQAQGVELQSRLGGNVVPPDAWSD